MKFKLVEANASRYDIVNGYGVIGAVYWFANTRNQERPFNVVLNRKDEGMFKDLTEVREFLSTVL